jgi:cytochrome c-type biogenesis protein CcmF
MGSWWAYYTLGWGGWWFWDPVENASFMPWLVGTALIHSSIVVEKRDTLKSWTILLAIVTFSLSLIGTFLVRSGVLSSVHAFAVDPLRGSFILILLIVAIGGSLTLYAVRAPALTSGGLFAPVSREGALLLNNVLLTSCAATVFLGTLYPLFLDAFDGAKVSVGAPFFNRTFVPMMVPVLIAMAVGPMLSWKRGDLLGALQRLWVAFAVACVVTLGLLYATYGGPVLAVFGIGVAVWTGMGVVSELADRVRLFRIPVAESARRAINLPRSAIGMTLAHLGIAISVAGISASAFEREHLAVVPIGGDFTLAGYVFHFARVETVQGPNFVASEATIEVRHDGALITVAHPERRYFALQNQTTSVTAIRTDPIADLYLALGEPAEGGGWTIRAYWKPLVSWIWGGALIMAFGGMVSLSDRRWRVGAAARSRRAVPRPAAAE